jgi:CubicO group peptidase (beta-lactamase class C family)
MKTHLSLAWTLTLFALVIAPGAAFSQALQTASPEQVGLSSERLDRIDALMQRYVDEGRMAGALGMIIRHGKVGYVQEWGMRDLEAGDPMARDDIFRIYSMTKPITSVAVMMLHEDGHFFLTDPIGRYLPELASMRVAQLGEATSGSDIPTDRAHRQITIQDLLRHTSGLTYGAFSNTPVDSLYRTQRVLGQPSLADMVTQLAAIPLVAQPGERWTYSVSTDVLGRLVEVVSGQPFDVFLKERIFDPLGMHDTGFYVPESELDRFARTYARLPDNPLTLGDTLGFKRPPTAPSGGGGLVSTIDDYARFSQMLLNGGELDGVRLLSPTTVDLMTVDHLDGEGYSPQYPGWGFGLGFAVKTKAGLDGMPGSVGDYNWGGLHGTSFWIDPAEDLIGIFMIQVYPNTDVNFRERFKQMVYQAIVK